MSSEMEMGDPQFRQPGVLMDSEDEYSGSTGWNFSEQRFGAFVFVVTGVVTVVLLIIIFLREVYWRKYGVDICPNFLSRRRPRRSDPNEEADRAMAEELQRQLNEEEREAERIAKRKERREWYEQYIKDFTMVAEKKDLFYAHEATNDDTTTPSLETGDGVARLEHEKETPEDPRSFKKLVSSVSEISDEEVDDIESGEAADNVCKPVACDESDEDAHLYLRLPVKDAEGNLRTVDAHCAICFSEYEEGDKVVWSGLNCQHAFHDECILPWLAKGKKRCPICRHWFVPGAKIEDQKRELEERLRLASSSSTTETSDETDNSQSEDNDNASQSNSRDEEQSQLEIPSGSSDSSDVETDAAILQASAPNAQQDADDLESAIAAAVAENRSKEHFSPSKDGTSRPLRLESEELTSEVELLENSSEFL